MPSFFDLLARSSRDSHGSSRSTEISIRQQEIVEAISNELIADGLPTEVAGDVLAFAGGFDFEPGRGRGPGRGRRGGRRGGHRGHHGHHGGHHGDSHAGGGYGGGDDLPEETIDWVDPIAEPAWDLDQVETFVEDVVEVPEDVDVDQSYEQEFSDFLDEYADEEYEVDPDDVTEVIEEIDDPAVDELVAGGSTLTLTQIEQLFEMYFNTIINTNNNISNNTYVDQSDNSINTYNIDNSINAVIDQSDNSVNDSYNTVVDNSVNNFDLTYTEISLSNIITGERGRGRENVSGTRDDDLIGAGRGRDRLSGRGGADDFLFDEAGDCGRRQADVIRDFSAEEGDRILLDAESFDGDGTVAVADNRRQFRQLRKQGDADFLYYQPKGGLYYDENGEGRGFGDGGLMAALRGAPELGAEQIQLV